MPYVISNSPLYINIHEVMPYEGSRKIIKIIPKRKSCLNTFITFVDRMKLRNALLVVVVSIVLLLTAPLGKLVR